MGSYTTFFIYAKDEDYEPTEEQVEKAIAYFDEIGGGDYYPSVFDHSEHNEEDDPDYESDELILDLDDGTILPLHFTIYMADFLGCSKHWALEEYEPDEYSMEIEYGTELLQPCKDKFEEILGTKLGFGWNDSMEN